MENASKALIIAGAILLSILIIAIGMYIYNSSQNTMQTAVTQISAQEIQSFNQTWEMYEGPQTGSNVKSLISKLSTGAKSNEEEESRLPDLYIEPTGSDDKKGVKSGVGAINVTGFNKAKTAVQARHTYYVTLIQSADTSLIAGIAVTYEKPSGDDEIFALFDESTGALGDGFSGELLGSTTATEE